MLLPVLSTGLFLEDTGLFLDRGLGRNLIWEFCLLKVPEPQRSVVCPLRRPLIGLHRDQQQGPHACVIQEAAHRLVSAGILSAGIRWVIAFRKSLFFIWLVSPCPLDQVLILLVPLGKPQRLSTTRCISIQVCSPRMYTHTQQPSHQEQTLSLCWAHGRAAYIHIHSDPKRQALRFFPFYR